MSPPRTTTGRQPSKAGTDNDSHSPAVSTDAQRSSLNVLPRYVLYYHAIAFSDAPCSMGSHPTEHPCLQTKRRTEVSAADVSAHTPRQTRAHQVLVHWHTLFRPPTISHYPSHTGRHRRDAEKSIDPTASYCCLLCSILQSRVFTYHM